jgi:endonuclease/exonuclease/phosphatase family metal-dependent hydrolase
MKFPKLTVIEWLIVVCIIILAASILKPILFPERDIFPVSACATNLKVLGIGIIIYNDDFGKYPTPDKWCDLLIENNLFETKESGRPLKCPQNQKDICSYAMNPNCEPNSPDDVVLLFESKGGWNQYGGPELLNFDNHEGKGCNILFNDFTVRFIYPEEVAELNWGHKKETITTGLASTTIKVLSFNIAGDSEDWETRKPACYDVINTLKPDIIGFQELLPVNLQWALDNFPHLSWYGQTIEGNPEPFPPDVEGESCRILYDKNRFTIDTADSGAFWFSPTPDVSSEGWDDFRYCVYARLLDKKTSDGIYVYNTHWAYGSGGQYSRNNAARILTDRIADRAHPEDSFIVTGDFNARSDDEGIQILLQNMTAVVENRIDWIFTENDKYELLSSEIISDIDGTAPSDHDVLSAELKTRK